MRIRYLFLNLFLLAGPGLLSAQESDAVFVKALDNINRSVLNAQMGFLASDWTEGRETGQKGEYLAGDYIASLFQLYGLKPGGDYQRAGRFSNLQNPDARTYFQNFMLIRTTPGEEQVMKIRSTEGKSVTTIVLTNNIDFTIRRTGQSIEIEAPVVFAGYGFRSLKLKHDDFTKLDVKGKFVLKLSGAPGYARSLLTPSELSAAQREAESVAREMGAIGIIEFNPNSFVAGTQNVNEFLNMSPSENNPAYGRERALYSLPRKESSDNFIRMNVSVKTANEILKGSGFILDEFIKRSESEGYDVLPVLKGREICLKTTARNEIVRARNVIGYIEGENPEEVIVVGAHYDHMGISGGYIWNGADDNASGTVVVLTVAKAFMETGIKPARTMIFALWSAEEVGLLGSRYYVENLTYPLRNLRLNMNFDMISRYVSDDEPEKVSMVYTEAFPLFRSITEQNNIKYGIGLDIDFQPSKDPPGGSDHRSFTAAGIPVMRFKPGHREEYHTPYDEITTVDWDIMEKIVKISFADLWDLANRDW
jgi:hypothetical protein